MRCAHDNPARRTGAPAPRRPAFTLAEVLFSILIIGLLIGLLIVGLRSATDAAQRQAGESTVRAIAQGAELFRSEFGFPIPLVHDGDMTVGGPLNQPLPFAVSTQRWLAAPIDTDTFRIYNQVVAGETFDRWTPAVYTRGNFETERFLRGLDEFDPAPPPYSGANRRERYSKFSLPYYLVGALGSAVDGVDGPGMVEVERTGSFRGVRTDPGPRRGVSQSRRRYDPFFEPDSDGATIQVEYLDPIEYREHGNSPPAQAPTMQAPFLTALVDRRGKAFRYYRWETGNFAGEIEDVLDLNIPEVLLDPEQFAEALAQDTAGLAVTADPTLGDTELRSARWAIVGAGVDGVFGTEPIEVLAAALGRGGSLGGGNAAAAQALLIELQTEARLDNVVALGR